MARVLKRGRKKRQGGKGADERGEWSSAEAN